MWRLLSLNKKLLILLVAVQSIVLLLGVFGLIHWMELTRINDLYTRLDNRGDAIEDLLAFEQDHWIYHHHGEVAAELDKDRLTYFELQDESGQPAIQSESVSQEVRDQLHKALVSTYFNHEEFVFINVMGSQWIFQHEEFHWNNHDVVAYAVLYTGINVEDAFEEIKLLRNLAFFVVIILLLLTASGSYMVIGYSTRNIRKFAHDIRNIRPPGFSGSLEMIPQSAEEKLLFDSYAEMINILRASLESQHLFIANASHELKTPIAAALSALEVTLSRPRTAEDYENTCKDVMAELQTLKRLSSTLMDLARLDGTTTDPAEKCDINDVISHVVDRWGKQARDKGIHLHPGSPQNACKAMTGSIEMWEVIIGNLVDNAIKYGRTDGNVWIDAQQTLPDTYEISIRDDGPGMTEDEMAQLGKVFYRADLSRSGNNSFGIGFAHAKRLVEHLGGSVSVHKAGDCGMTIIITIHTRTV